MAVLSSAAALADNDVWSVVGNHAIMNGSTDWAIAEAANDLTTTDGVNYTLTVTDKTLEKGTTYEYKYAKDHAWTVSIPQSGNLSMTVSETAVYTLVYSVNVSTSKQSVVATKTGEAGEVTHAYSIAGSSTDLFGASWSETSTATDMTKGADGIYTWTAKDVALPAGNISYKVVQDHAWGVSYPASNATLTVAGAGNYDVTITFNPTTKAVSGTATPKSEVVVNYFLKSEWQEDGAETWTWRQMTEQENGTYTLETLYTGNGCNYDTTDTGSGSWLALDDIAVEEGLSVGDACTYTLTPCDGSVTISVSKREDTAVRTASAANAKSSAAYNVAGQRISKDAKGLVIVGGKKIIK